MKLIVHRFHTHTPMLLFVDGLEMPKGITCLVDVQIILTAISTFSTFESVYVCEPVYVDAFTSFQISNRLVVLVFLALVLMANSIRSRQLACTSHPLMHLRYLDWKMEVGGKANLHIACIHGENIKISIRNPKTFQLCAMYIEFVKKTGIYTNQMHHRTPHLSSLQNTYLYYNLSFFLSIFAAMSMKMGSSQVTRHFIHSTTTTNKRFPSLHESLSSGKSVHTRTHGICFESSFVFLLTMMCSLTSTQGMYIRICNECITV